MVQNIEETTGDATKKLLLNSFHVNEDSVEKHEKHGIFYGLYFGRQRFSKC